MIGWHCQLNGHGFEQASGVDNGQGSLVTCSPWGSQSWTQLAKMEGSTEEVKNWYF